MSMAEEEGGWVSVSQRKREGEAGDHVYGRVVVIAVWLFFLGHCCLFLFEEEGG